MSEELKPCPICGGKAYIAKDFPPDEIGVFYSVKCGQCGASSGEKYANETCPIFFEGLRGKWNERPAEDALKARIVELECFCEEVRDHKPAHC